jgi:hypothetical protein
MLRIDSPLWTNPASNDEPFAHLEVPDNLEELVKRAVTEADRNLKERLKPYKTKIQTLDLLRDLD